MFAREGDIITYYATGSPTPLTITIPSTVCTGAVTINNKNAVLTPFTFTDSATGLTFTCGAVRTVINSLSSKSLAKVGDAVIVSLGSTAYGAGTITTGSANVI